MDTAFTPVASFGGGLLIGLAAVLLMLTLGRIMGATGILSGAILPSDGGDFAWRGAVLAGMVSAPPLLAIVAGVPTIIEVPVTIPMLVGGGLLVGLGVSFGGGCTSGHSVCGNARFSARSIVATLTFMATAGLTVFVIRHIIGG